MSTPPWPRQVTITLPSSDPTSAIIGAWLMALPPGACSAAVRARLAESITLHETLTAIQDQLAASQDRLSQLDTQGVAPRAAMTEGLDIKDNDEIAPVDAATLHALLDFSGDS